ncbi:hypothetical protein ES702_05810 [subsurface metagenome]
MAEWLAPFHRPRMTTEKFEKMKADYIAKYGYTISVPGLSDIIKIPTEKKITLQEELDYKKKNWNAFGPNRLAEIRKMKQKRKDRFLAMLGSPTPAIFRNAGSILTALDDCQDALSTLSVMCRIAIAAAPRILGKLMSGPVGWLLTTLGIMNLVMNIGRMPQSFMAGKRIKDGATGDNPFTKKAAVARARKLRKGMPTKGDFIETLQTTDQIFGVGLCLGPIVGLVQDIFFGTVRTTFKKPPKLLLPKPDLTHWYKVACRAVKSTALFFGGPWYTDDDMLLEVYMAAYLAHQDLSHFQQEWNPLDTVQDPQDLYVQAPIPQNVLSLEVIEEEGIPLEEVCGWPHNDQLWGNITDISDANQGPTTQNLHAFMKRNEHNWMGYSAGVLASETAFNSLVNLEGPEEIRYDYTIQSKIGTKFLQNGYYPDPDQPADKLDRLVMLMDYCERTNYNITFADLKISCDRQQIRLIQIP